MNPIPKHVIENFQTLWRAFEAGDAALMTAIDKETGEDVYLIVAIERDGDEYITTPFAIALDTAKGNPFERFIPPGG